MNHPVSAVSWDEALAYCEWLTATLRAWPGTPETMRDRLLEAKSPWIVTLPSEAEWERATRGTTGRRYPWGNEAGTNRANCRGTRLGRTSAVGCFSKDATPDGIEDLVGNIGEWTRSEWRDYPYLYNDGRDRLDEVRGRVVRGGAFIHDRVRAAYRYRYDLGGSGYVGFRVVVSQFNSVL